MKVRGLPIIDTFVFFGPNDAPATVDFDVEPSTFTDRRGFSAVAFHVGTATGSDGATYNLETDMRAFEGDYVVDGEERHGAFALV